MLTPTHGPSVRLARSRDASELLSLRRIAEDWLAERGVEQWSPGEVALGDVVRQIERREWFVSTMPNGIIAAALRFLDHDREIWPDTRPGRRTPSTDCSRTATGPSGQVPPRHSPGPKSVL